MTDESKLLDQLPDLRVVIAFVETKILGLVPGGHRLVPMNLVQRLLQQLHVVPVRAGNHDRQRDAHRIGQEAALHPLLAPIRRILTRFFEPASGALVCAPSNDSQLQSIPLSASYRASCFSHSCSKTPPRVHSMNRRWAELLVQMPVTFRAFHWHPLRSTNRIAFIASRLFTRGRWQPSGWGFPGGSNGSISSHSSFGIRQPSSFATIPIERTPHLLLKISIVSF